MSFILHIETATTVCSVAISSNSELLFLKELDEGFTHAENLHLFINQALEECKLQPQQLAAVAVSKGPGSYTGLRIGASTAKGLAYALGIPLISVDTLQVMSQRARKEAGTEAVYCPMIDARRMEVYTSVYNNNLEQEQTIEARIVDETFLESLRGRYSKIWFFGDGMPKCRELLSRLPEAGFIDNCYPSAAHMPELVFNKYQSQDFENLAYFEPFYLKDFLILKKKGQ